MGCCCSCFEKDEVTPETELSQAPPSAEDLKALSISRAMSAPSIDVQERTKITGKGLALAGVAMEQDTAYWEAHIAISAEDARYRVWFGVASKKTREFYKEKEQGESSEPLGVEFMQAIEVGNEDTIGIAVQQSDLPMISFLRNGEPVGSVNRFRGTVYPAVCLPADGDGLSVKIVFDENDWQEMAPSVRFGPVIVARGLV